MRQKLARFMEGRNGMDELARAESVLVLVTLILSLFFWPLDILAIVLLVHMYFRVFSRNLTKRYEENQKWVNFRYHMTVRNNKRKKRFAQRKTYKFFTCPNCKQDVRVPRGHGKIMITCPKCRTEFQRKS